MTRARVWLVLVPLVLAGTRLRGEERLSPDWSLRGEALGRMLADLARKQGQDPEDYSAFRAKGASGLWSDAGDVVTVRADNRRYVVAVQTVVPMSVPGVAAQQFVLLDTGGEILDRFQCHANSRYGRLEARVSSDVRDARIEVTRASRLPGAPYTITVRERFYTFGERPLRSTEAVMIHQLCCAEIVDGKFAITRPLLEQPELVLSQATSLRVRYPVAREVKSIRVADRSEIAAVFRTLHVEGTEQGHLLGARCNATIDAQMPNGAMLQLVFRTRTLLQLRDWGLIHLASDEFHATVAALVAKAEGGVVDIVPDESVR